MINKEIAVFTTVYVIKKKSPITFVSHDEDGDWQFFSSEDVSTADSMVVSLEELLAIDSSINKILDMPTGCEARRSGASSDWVILNRG